MTGVISAYVAQLVIITYRGFKDKTESAPIAAPLPADYVAASVLYGALSLGARTRASGVVNAVAWGLVVATLVNLWTPKNPTKIKHVASTKKAAAPAKKPATTSG